MTDAIWQTPQNPGTYLQFVSEDTIRPSASVAATVAVPVTHDWGPLGSESGAVQLNSFAEWEATFGNSPSDGRDAVLGVFLGPGLQGSPGAGSVIVYRAAADAVRSTHAIQNTDDTPVTALTLKGKYAGSRGNRVKYAIDADPANEDNQRLRILFDDSVVEQYVFAAGVASSLAAVINARSGYVQASGPYVDTDPLATSAGTALTGGDDGDDIVGSDYIDALNALEFEPFSVFAPANVSDSAIQASIVAWVDTMVADDRPVMAVTGGPDAEGYEDALARVADLPDDHLVALGAGTFHDAYLGKDVNTAQIAPRVAGALAGLGESASLTFLKFAQLTLVGPAAVPTDKLHEAAAAGLTVFRRTSSTEADLMVARGVTTYTDESDPSKDPAIFGDPRLVRVLDLFIREMKQYGDDNIVGQTVVGDATKAAVKSYGDGMIKARLDAGLILPGATDAEKPFFRLVDPAAVGAPEDSIPFEFGFQLTKTTNYLIGNGRVR